MMSVSYTEWNCKAKLNLAPTNQGWHLVFSQYSCFTAVSNFDHGSMTLMTSPNLTVGGINTVVRYSLSNYLLWGDMVLFRVLCCHDLTPKLLVLFVQLFALRTSSYLKHDKGAPLVKYGNTRKSRNTHPPLRQTYIRCSTHGCSFVRLLVSARFLLVCTKQYCWLAKLRWWTPK